MRRSKDRIALSLHQTYVAEHRRVCHVYMDVLTYAYNFQPHKLHNCGTI